jgi:hypothetical protein
MAATTRIAYNATKMADRAIRTPKPLSKRDYRERKNIIIAAGRPMTTAEIIESRIA